MTKQFSLLLIILFLCLSFFSCDLFNPYHNAIVGKWINQGANEELNFNSNNTAFFSASNQIEVTWSISSAQLTIDWGNSIKSYSYTLSGQTLSIDWDFDGSISNSETYSKSQ